MKTEDQGPGVRCGRTAPVVASRRMRFRPALCRPFLAGLIFIAVIRGDAAAQVYKGTTLVEASLIADTTAVVPGRPFRLGVLLKMAPRWHTYWEFAGDAGLPTRIEWTLPPGFGAGPIEWPLPESLLEPGGIRVYAYGGEVLLLTTIQPPANLKTGGEAITISAAVSWLVCEAICIPGRAAVSIDLPVADAAEPANAALFSTYAALLPSPGVPPFEVAWRRQGANLIATAAPGADVTKVDFLPLPAQGQVLGPVESRRVGTKLEVTIEVDGDLTGVLALTDAAGRRGWYVSTGAKAAAGGAGSPGIWLALVYGFLGGVILNLMPCVLPVISLKIFGFIRQGGESPRRILLHGVAFAAGIFAWFLGLGAVVVFLKSSGAGATWAFQFQNPIFNFVIATIVFVFALNLFGVFEIVLPGRAAGAMSDLGGREGFGGSFFQGMFATLLATPCTGPFLGGALGFAFSQPPAVIMAMFGSVALGMAAPYLLLSARPGWMKFLPKPGPWMERLKQFMGFPLLATLLWLLYIIGKQAGLDAVIWAAAALLSIGLACWIYGAFCGFGHRPGTRALALAAVVASLAAGLYFARLGFSPKDDGGIAWIDYSKATVQSLLDAGKPVFIDFTADWCITCKFNERTAIARPAVEALIREKGIVPVRADWTNSNPEITEALARFGRVGVPFYVFYPAGNSTDPITLPELITEQIVLDALGRAR